MDSKLLEVLKNEDIELIDYAEKLIALQRATENFRTFLDNKCKEFHKTKRFDISEARAYVEIKKDFDLFMKVNGGIEEC